MYKRQSFDHEDTGTSGDFFAGKVTIEGISKPTLKLELSGQENFITSAERLLRALADI